MITIKDVLVGNWVNIKLPTGLLTETQITPSDIRRLAGGDSSCYIPIPITENMLVERCGMHLATLNKGVTAIDVIEAQVGTGSLMIKKIFIPNGGLVLHYKDIKIPLKGLHHLQNIYYFLFGKELEIK